MRNSIYSYVRYSIRFDSLDLNYQIPHTRLHFDLDCTKENYMESCGAVSIGIANEGAFNRSMHTYKFTFRGTINLGRAQSKLGHSRRFIFCVSKLYRFRENSRGLISMEMHHACHSTGEEI